jgi:hypothetical protein
VGAFFHNSSTFLTKNLPLADLDFTVKFFFYCPNVALWGSTVGDVMAEITQLSANRIK